MKCRKSLTVKWRIVSMLGEETDHGVTDDWWLLIPHFYTNFVG